MVPLGHPRGEKPFLRCPLGTPRGNVPGTVGFAGLEVRREVWVGDRDLDKSRGNRKPWVWRPISKDVQREKRV